MLTLYGKALSRAARCLWVLEETGLPYVHVPVDPLKDESRTPEFLRLNSAGKIPVLVDDGFVLTESIAITSYLAMLQPTPLWPDDIKSRARILQWSSWALSEIEPPVTRLFRSRRGAAESGQAAPEALAAACIKDITAALETLEGHLSHGSEHLASNSFSLADINAASSVTVAPMLVDMGPFPATTAWLARIFARAAWQRVKALP